MVRPPRSLTALATLCVAWLAARAESPPTFDPTERPLYPQGPVVPEPHPAAKLLIGPTPGFETPLGYSGPSRIAPRSGDNDEYQTVEDRWRLGFPEWDRRGLGQQIAFDENYSLGRLWDSYNLNVLKGDYPIYGQHTFLNITGTTTATFETRQVPTPSANFETYARPGEYDFFGKPTQFSYQQPFFLSFDLFQGDAGFKPADWRVHLTPAFNVNYLSLNELSVVNSNPLDGTNRVSDRFALQEWFVEAKLFDIGSEYDFASIRVGSQPFTSDFRGFIFSDTNRGVRLFGNAEGNRDQFNLVYFRQQEKDTNSGLNTFDDRNQNIFIANFYRQDFLFPGYTQSFSFHYNNDGPYPLTYNSNDFLVRPDATGIASEHRVEAYYLGMAGDGHIGRFNISHAEYIVLGRDSMNPIAGQSQDIFAQMAAVELSYDRDWVRFRLSYLYQSGDGNINNTHATGFDSIQDNMNFGGEASFWNRQSIGLFNVNLMQQNSLYNDLRSSKIQGQSNFVNPGLQLVGAGIDFEITPRLRLVNNCNFLWFDKTNVLETFVFQSHIDRDIGTDLSTELEYRPFLSNNVIMKFGLSTLLPGGGYRQLFNSLNAPAGPPAAAFMEMTFTY